MTAPGIARRANDELGGQYHIESVPARLLGDMVKSFDQAPVELEAEGGQARIMCANYEGTIRCLPVEDFPSLQEPQAQRAALGAPPK